MSAAGMSWALDAPAEGPAERLVLVLLGDSATDDGSTRFVYATLAASACLTVDELVGVVAGLERRGLLRVTGSEPSLFDGDRGAVGVRLPAGAAYPWAASE